MLSLNWDLIPGKGDVNIPEGVWDRCVPEEADFQQRSKNDGKNPPDIFAEWGLEKWLRMQAWLHP